MIQDIAPHRLRIEYEPGAAPQAGDPLYLFAERERETLWCRVSGGQIALPTVGEMCGKGPRADFLPEVQAGAEEEGAWAFHSLRGLRSKGIGAREDMFAAYTAAHLFRWYRDNRFCGTCGAPTVPADDERAVCCSACGRRIYPRIQPAVIVAVTNGDEIVLTRYAGRAITYHALVAGFVEIGETAEQTVAREVMEEVGLRVKNLRYYKSQPWATADDLLIGFFCDVDGDPTIRLDEHELKEAVWVRREDVDSQPDDFSLTNEMMQVFRRGEEPR